jgi:hypothetical protein
MEGSLAELINSRSTLRPKFFYNCKSCTNQLNRINLLTGEQSCLQLPGYQFKDACRWSELPGGRLLITGEFDGYSTTRREVVMIDTLREWAVVSQPPMHTARSMHAAVYHAQHLYVLGGFRSSFLSECERYVCADSRWEVLPALPVAGCGMSAVALNSSLYVLGD